MKHSLRAAAGPVARFLAVGAFNTTLGYVLFRGLIHVAGGRPNAAGAAQAGSYAACVGVSYFLNRQWTFRAEGAHGRALLRFVAAQLALLALSAALIQFLVSWAGASPSKAWVAATAATTMANFVAQRYWVFPTAQAPRHAVTSAETVT